MIQPDNFGFGEEAALLKASARKFFADTFDTAQLHALVAADHDPERMSACAWDQDLWRQMVALGWPSLAVPESAGGLGVDAVAVAGLVEELGRAAFPCPLLGTLNATYVLAACGAGAGHSPGSHRGRRSGPRWHRRRRLPDPGRPPLQHCRSELVDPPIGDRIHNLPPLDPGRSARPDRHAGTRSRPR